MPLPPSECRFYELVVTYDACIADEISIKVGANCSSSLIDPTQGYTGTYGNYSCANEATSTIGFIPQESGLQINLLSQPADPISLCANETYEVEIKNTKTGTVYDIEFDITIPSDGIQFVPNTFYFSYPYDAVTPTQVSDPVFVGTSANGNVYRFNLKRFKFQFRHRQWLNWSTRNQSCRQPCLLAF